MLFVNRILLGLLLIFGITFNASSVCVESEPLCVDGQGSKFIDGVEVYRECWNYQLSKECTSNETIDYCAALKATPACSQIQYTCTATSMSGECLKSESVYRCSEKTSDDANIEEINFSHTIRDEDDTSECATFLDNPNCFIAEERCVEGPATNIINGVSVYKDCWKKELNYACSSAGVLNSCLTLDKIGCTPVGETTCIKQEAGKCTQYQSQYKCVNKDPVEGDGITPDGEPSKPGYDPVPCELATEGKKCKVVKTECDYDDDKFCVTANYTYECVETVDQNQCAPLEAASECTQQKSTCVERDGLKCIAYKKEILCQGDKEIEAPDAEILDQNIAIGDITWTDTCLPIQENPACEITGSKCVETGDKEINGEIVSKDCWKYEHTYVCTDGARGPGDGTTSSKNDCDKLEGNDKCTKVDSSCIAVDANGWVNAARSTVTPSGEVKYCPEALADLDRYLNDEEITVLKKRLGSILAPDHIDPGSVIARTLPQSEALLLGMSRSLEASLKHSIMLVALPEGMASIARQAGAPLDLATKYATSQANLTSEINYRTLSMLA